MAETKNGESYEGTLEGCDNYMNIKLKDVILTTAEGKFSKFDIVFIRGNNVKAIQLNEDIITNYQSELKKKCRSFLCLTRIFRG